MRPLIFLLIAILPLSLATSVLPQAPVTESSAGTFILNEICPFPSDGIEWVELLNTGSESASLSGWSLRFFSGAEITFEDNLPPCLPDECILVALGGASSSFQNQDCIVIGTPVQLDDSGDGCTLYSPDGAIDTITWGRPGYPDEMPLAPGSPLNPQYGSIPDDEVLYKPDDVLIRIPGSWSSDGTPQVGTQNWVYRNSDQASSGNPVNTVGPWLMMPEDGATFASDFFLAFTGLESASGITFQIATDSTFSNIVLELQAENGSVSIENISAGTYYWRIKYRLPGLNFDQYSGYRTFIREDFNIDELEDATSQLQDSERYLARGKSGAASEIRTIALHRIGVTHICQGKDTEMVCLDGCNMYGNYFWDNSHPYGFMEGEHNNVYCVRASIAMIANWYGCSLSQDRISYNIFEEAGNFSDNAAETGHIGDPLGDLGHGNGVYHKDCRLAMDWLFNQPSGSSVNRIADDEDIFSNNTPELDTIREYIDLDKPLIRHLNQHAVVIDGYKILERGQTQGIWLHILNPWWNNEKAERWQLFKPSTDMRITFPPAFGIAEISDEPGLSTDTDQDGLMDFDETNRFRTDPQNPDSDNDGVADKDDIRGYVFTKNGDYNPRPRDIDGDGDAKELDPDNDDPENKSANDGCEDTNLNGLYEPESDETSNFVLFDDFSVANSTCVNGIIRCDHTIDINTQVQGQQLTLYQHWYEEIIILAESVGSSGFDHLHRWARELNMNAPFATSQGEDQDMSGGAKVTLERNPETGEYAIITDVDTVWTPFERTFMSNMPVPGFPIIIPQTTEAHFGFDNNARFELGVPVEESGGLILKGERDLNAEAGGYIPGVENVLWWEIWITPPNIE